MLNKEERSYLNASKDLTVGVFIYYPPYQFVNDNNEVDGILIDYFELIEEKIGHRFKKKIYNDWQRLINDTKANNIQIIIEIQKTEERSKFLSFTEPIFSDNHLIITKKTDTLKTLEDFNNKVVTVGAGFSIEEYIVKNYPQVIILPKLNETACLKALVSGEADAFVGIESVSNYYIAKEGIKNLKTHPFPDYKYELSIGVSKEEPVLSGIINKANTQISPTDKKVIINKWLYNIGQPFYKEFYVLDIMLLLVLTLALLFSLQSILKLKKKLKNLKTGRS